MRISRAASMKKLRFFLLQSYHTAMVLLAVAVGLLGGLCAVGFRRFIQLVQVNAWSMPAFSLEGIRAHHPWETVLIPTLGGLIVGLIIHYLAREAKGHGVPEVMEAVVLHGGRIRARIVLAKLVASGICIGTGGSVGREGPIVQIGAALGSAFGQILNLGERRLKTLVGCGAAAGIAATFNAPIAGALFAAEVILGDFAPTQLTPIVISSVSATVVSHHFFGDLPAFVIPTYSLVSSWELLLYGLLGLAAGAMAVLFIKVLYGAEDLFDGPLGGIPGPLRTAGGGMLIGLIALRFPETMGVGYEAIEMALHQDLVWQTLLLIAVIKIFAVSITIGSGGSGGIFAPSLMIGAMTGGALGSAVHSIWPLATATGGAYALVGAGAVVAASTQAPLTAVMIIFELTNDYKIILPLMIACVIATMFATRLNNASIYTTKLLRRGLDIFKGQSPDVLRHLCVRDAMCEPSGLVSPDTALIELVSQFAENRYGSIFVIDANQHLLGIITFDDLRPYLNLSHDLDRLVIAHDIMCTSDYPITTPTDTLDNVMRQLGRYRFEIPVVSENRLIGTILATDVIDRYNTEMYKRQMASSMVSSMQNAGTFEELPSAMGLSLAEIPVPASFIGQTCATLKLRQKYGITVLLVKTGSESAGTVAARTPDADSQFAPGDILLALGDSASLHKLELMI